METSKNVIFLPVIPVFCLLKPPTIDPSEVKLIFFSTNNPDGVDTPHTNGHLDLSQTNFNSSKPTSIMIPGWTRSVTDPFPVVTRDAYVNNNYNVFTVDWSRYSKAEYTQAFCAVGPVAQVLVEVIASMKSDYGLNLDNLVMIGHSLGAHMCGIIGEYLDGQLGTIIGKNFKLKHIHPLWNRKEMYSLDTHMPIKALYEFQTSS